MLFKWPVAKQWEQTFVKGIEAHADSSIAQTVVYLNRQKKDLCTCMHMYLLLPDLCTFIYCYLFYMWLTGTCIPGPQKKEVSCHWIMILTCGMSAHVYYIQRNDSERSEVMFGSYQDFLWRWWWLMSRQKELYLMDFW